MHNACPLSELAPGEALRLHTAPPLAAFNTEFTTEEGAIFAIDHTCTHPVSTSVRRAWTNRRLNCRSGLTKCKSSMATSWSSNRAKPPTFRPY